MDPRVRAWMVHGGLCAALGLLGLWAWGRAAWIAHHGVGLSGDAVLMIAAAALAGMCGVHVVASTALLAWKLRGPPSPALRSAHGVALAADVALLVLSPTLLQLAARAGLVR